MERLQRMLAEYNRATAAQVADVEWAAQYRVLPFPRYWRLVFGLLLERSNESRVIEVGCGCGDITSILCHQGFGNVRAFERDPRLSAYARDKLERLFGRTDVVEDVSFPTGADCESDILLMVNCVYADSTSNKEEYMESLLSTYRSAGAPGIAYIEVIDSSFMRDHPAYPMHVRLSGKDVADMFPGSAIRSWPTYSYPANGKSKTLYEIEAR